jgi:hypothetical protein
MKIQEQTTLIADTPKLSKINKLGSMKQRSLIKVLIKPISGAERLSLYYFTFKLLNLFNVLFQLIMLRGIFGHEFYRYGIDFIARFWQTNDAIFISKQFPIMTMCDYYTYQKLGRIHDNATQCLLIINFLIEKFFVVIWFWLIGLLFLTFFNILSWIIEIHTRNNRIGFIYKYLNIKCKMIHNAGLRRHSQTNSVNFSNKDTVSLRHDDVEEFCEKSLGKDGVVMCHILKACAGDIIFLEILNEFWLDFNRKIDD